MRSLGTVSLACAAVACASCGSNEGEGSRDPFSAVRQPGGSGSLERAAPHWERVEALRGSGDASPAVEISRGALQWRARWRCQSGRFTVAVAGRGNGAGACPASGSASWIREGRNRLAIAASGAWRVVVEEQVDTPLREPPLRGMRSQSAHTVARGRFVDVERRGRGTARLYRLPSGRLALRLEDFATAGNTDLFVWLSEAARPRTTEQAFRAPHTELAPLKSTLGDQNYILPADVTAGRIRSVVIWCEPVQIAYTAAALKRLAG